MAVFFDDPTVFADAPEITSAESTNTAAILIPLLHGTPFTRLTLLLEETRARAETINTYPCRKCDKLHEGDATRLEEADEDLLAFNSAPLRLPNANFVISTARATVLNYLTRTRPESDGHDAPRTPLLRGTPRFESLTRIPHNGPELLCPR